MSNNNPGWTNGYVPTPTEWNDEFSSKQDWDPALDALVIQGGPVAFTSRVVWTPVDLSPGSLVFTQTGGISSTVGNLCYAFFRLTYPTTADTSNAKFGGFPAVPSADNYSHTPNLLINPAGSYYGGVITTGPSGVLIQALSGGAMTNADLSGLTIRGALIYPIG